MIVLKRLFDLYIKSSIHVSLAVIAFCAITINQLDIHANPDLIFFVFFGTVSGYNFIKYAGIAKFRHKSLSVNLRLIQIFSLACFLGLIWFAFRLPEEVLWFAAIMGGLNLLYALPVFEEKNKLRSITGLKIFVIALVWTGVTVGLPVLENHSPISADTVIITIQRFLFVIALTLPFDIRDVHFDTEDLGTIPQLFGVEQTRNIGTGLLALVFILEFFRPEIEINMIGVLVVILIITGLLIRKSGIHQNKYYASFWVEGVPILWWFLLLIVN